MPTLEEIQDETVRAVNEKDDDEWDDENSDALSDDSSDDEEEFTKERGLVIPQETIWERISALKDIVPPSTRQSIASKISTFSAYGSVGLLIGGKIAWVVTTTALLVGLPYALAVEDEMRITQQERDMMAQQQGQSVLGGQSAQNSPGAQGIRPPGF